MEKYILKTVFILTLISLGTLDFAFALNSQGGFNIQKSDSLKVKKKVYLHEVKSGTRPFTNLSPEGLDSISRYLILDTDTGKYFRRFFFRDGSGFNKKLVDSLLLRFPTDSILRKFAFPADSIYQSRRRLFPNHLDNSIEMPNMLRSWHPGMRRDRFDLPDRIRAPENNSQSFSFRNIDKDGIISHLQINVNDPSEVELKNITAKFSDNNGKLLVDDLGFLPNFSSQTILLTFKLPARGAASVQVIDSDLKNVYSDNMPRFQGRYSKEIILPKNGIYFLVIRQNDKIFIKRLIKQG